MKVAGFEFLLQERFAQGDLCDLYHCTYKRPPSAEKTPEEKHPAHKTSWDWLLDDEDALGLDTTEVRGIAKVVRLASDNDLAENEAAILRELYPPNANDVKFYRYLPKLVGSELSDGKRVNFFPFLGEFVTFADILKAYPKGIDYRDLAWMLKRFLAGIGFAHTRGVIHGAVLPPHITVHPTGHGAKILDWSYAVRSQDKNSIRAYSADWKDYYAPEIFAKRIPTPATDLYMMAKCSIALLGGDVKTNSLPDAVPEEFKAFLKGCLAEAPSQRAQDAWDLHEKLDNVLWTIVGKASYRPFAMPSAS